MAIDYNVLVPIPEEANHPKTGTRVFLVIQKNYDADRHFNLNKRIEIGKAVSSTEMYPNDNYKQFFPETYNKYAPYNSQLPVATKIIGPYAMFLAIGQHTKLYEVLIKSFGPQNANMLMDYAMYSILTHSNVATDFQATMERHLLFSAKAYGDTWISDFFKHKMKEEMGICFRNNWLQECKENGITSAWVCIDGSNDDCDAVNMFEAEPGHDKSGNKGPIVSYMWAVSAKDGTPITYLLYRGSRVDSVALKEMVAVLADAGITTEGVILDRGFWNYEDIQCLQAANLDFIIMMKGGYGYDQMMERYGTRLREGEVSLMLQRSGEYGIVDETTVFKGLDLKLHVGLMYNNLRAVKETNKLTDQVKKAVSGVRESIEKNQPYRVSADVAPYITVTKYRGRKKDTVEIDDEKLQLAVNRKGFAALASSKALSAQELDTIYALRQHSEQQYSAFKTQLGYDVLRVYSPGSWHSKFACGFIAGILRNELEKKCTSIGVDTNLALTELCFVAMTRYRDRVYLYVHLMSLKAKAALNTVGLIEEDMEKIAEAENARLEGGQVHPVHQLPLREVVKRGPGRPKGSKNKKHSQKGGARAR